MVMMLIHDGNYELLIMIVTTTMFMFTRAKTVMTAKRTNDTGNRNVCQHGDHKCEVSTAPMVCLCTPSGEAFFRQVDPGSSRVTRALQRQGFLARPTNPWGSSLIKGIKLKPS